ncbi:MAG: epoxyqueuosine reductase, partial [Planctomycetes bacterium]|nr:epoxyqueuosine reductase [Planctomycetota bacterium]
LCNETAGIIEQHGHKAIAFEPTIDVLDRTTLRANFSHKTAATRAGLGWIGKSALLITKKYGAAVRLGTVLTDAELETGEPIDQSQCGECRGCQEHCPAGAILGKNWEAGMAREAFYDAFTCCEKAVQLCKRQNLEATICGICINVCPWTQKYLKRSLKNSYE